MVSLELRNVSVGYGSRVVLEGVSCAPLEGGKLVGLLGPNACGKSTLIKTIAGVHKSLGGEVLLRGTRERPGYVPQGLPESVALSAFESVLISARRVCEDPMQATGEVLAALGFGEIAGRYLSELSGGQRQMVAVAQMLVSNPEVMLLDEPTSALDLHRQLFVLQTVRERARATGALGVVAIHDINLAARLCDELIVLHAGKLLAQGTPEDVLTPELLQQVYQVHTDIFSHRDLPVVIPTAVAGEAEDSAPEQARLRVG
ncbi:ABC transporter ATP-binding protein [Corynebacterium gerontici]|uniref:Iron(3+)-hydroxamate import ATP-binding protein FhuC n=1 Tax=Corynebacterium gerontici TaxID=2079234 RepID=A0A3G6IYE4_9CORY|nr:ABC transporter ATP-binding protein [Corynebacterium gerontici]AZA10722.1 Iron(3+)-hydroxamate import ATP-binding protein FhuC [Corynebacterium gerontici]